MTKGSSSRVPAWLRTAAHLAVCAAVGGAVSLLLGRDVSAGPLAYTLYPAHAFLSGRMTADIFAAGAAPALNPLLYVPYYLAFVKLNARPDLSLFLSGVPYGLFISAVWAVCSRVFEKQGKLFSGAFTALSVTGGATLAAVGAGDGALWLAVLGAWACHILFYPQNGHAQRWAFFLAAFAAGLHFSAVSALVGLLCAAAVLYAKRGKTDWLGGAACLAAGLVLSLSFGIWYAWRTGALDSFWTFFWPQGWAFAPSPWASRWEIPSGIQEWIFLPVWRLRYAMPGFQLDPRLGCGLLAAAVLLGKRCFGKKKERSREEIAWSVFYLGTYIVWLVGFRDASSAILLEFTGVLLLGRCLIWLAGSRLGTLLAALLLWVVFQTTLPAGRPGTEDCNFAFFKEPVLTAKPLVLLAGYVSGWVPFLPQEARYVGGVWFDPQDYNPTKEFFLHRLNPLPAGYYSHRRDGQIQAAVRAHEGDIYVIMPNEKLAEDAAVWRRYGIKLAEPRTSCQQLYPNGLVNAKELLLCRAEKLPNAK